MNILQMKDLHTALKQLKKHYLVILIFVIFLVKVNLFINQPMIGQYDGMGDAQPRVMMVAAHNFIPTHGTWMPLLFNIIKTSLAIYDNPHLSPRFFSAVINLYLVIILFIYFKHVTRDRLLSLIIIFLFLSSHFINSYFTFPLAEPIFSASFFTAMYFLVKNKNFSTLLISLLFFNICNALRYEGWYLFPPMLFLAYRQARPIKQLVFFSFMYFIYPIYWIWQNYLHTGDWMFFLNEKITFAHHSLDYMKKIGNVGYALNWLKKIYELLGMHQLLLIVCGLIVCFKQRRYRTLVFFFALSVYLIILLILQVYTGSMEWFPVQYLYLPYLFLIPFVAIIISSFIKSQKTKNGKLFSLLVIFFVITASGFYDNYKWLYVDMPNPESKIIQVLSLNTSTIGVFFPAGYVHTDLDWLMYFSYQYHYQGHELAREKYCDVLSAGEFDSILIFDTLDETTKIINQCLMSYKIMYSDARMLFLTTEPKIHK
ncbi:hypothetical protein KA078_01865 [Candidatus Woesebacteria bacterium]|nr:hypothetical protein [Candidatus Woesebacteria bacterium]